MPFVRSAYNYDRAQASLMATLDDYGPDLTIQSQAKEADINVLVANYGITGNLPVIQPPPALEDFQDVFDFQSAMNVIRASQESFAMLDAKVRARFGNDAGQFVDFCSNPDNYDEAVKLGLALKKPDPFPEPAPMKVQVVNPEPPQPAK